MSWFLLCAILGSTIAVAFIFWRKWIAPWREIEQLVQQIGRGEQPRTFLVGGAREAERVGVALEDILLRQQKLDREIAKNASGSRTIFGAMQDGFLVLDSARRITLFNRAFRELFENEENSLGTVFMEAVRHAGVVEVVAETFQKREAVRREITIGTEQFEINSVPMRLGSGEMSGAVVLFHDITELKRVDQMRRDFVANVSHELRTPLSIFRGYLETLLENPRMPLEELRRIFEVMERHSDRLNTLVEDVLSLARLEAAEPHLDFSEIDLADFLQMVAGDWKKRLAAKELRLRLEVAKDLPPLCADENRVQEIIYNLLDNAVKYSPPGGEIVIGAEPADEKIAIKVSDAGSGIAADDLPHIFERFYRADKARTRELGGTGLGLSIVKHIVQLHGGSVEAQSEIGRGTTIRVQLPREGPPVTQT